MFHQIKRVFAQRDEHQPCGLHRQESAGLRAELHQMFDEKRALQNHAARLEAENRRLTDANTSLRLHQKDSLIEELADRLLEHKSLSEYPHVTLPCPHHVSAEISFAAA